MTIKVLYIDDEISRQGRDGQKMKELLHVPGQFEIDLQPPPASFTDLPANIPDALLIDQELTTKPEQGEPVSYHGTTLATEVRWRNPSCPIILITRPEMITGRTQLIKDSLTEDLIVFKDEINRDPEGARTKIATLIAGFKALESVSRQEWTKVLSLMKVTEDEANLLRAAAPPIEDKQWNIPQTARWILTVVMEFPGILYDDLTSATRLGITIGSFQKPMVQELLQEASYSGVFGTHRQRWWRDRLFGIAQRLIMTHQLRGSISENFAKAFTAEYKEALESAKCVYDSTPIADWVCYILKQPVKQENSLPYYPDQRPSVMDQARVSFKAIRESNDFDESLVDADSYEIVRKLWE